MVNANPNPNPGPSGSSSGTVTYASTTTTTQVSVVPSIVTRSEQIAHYFAEDLEVFLQRTHIDLAQELHIPMDYSHDPRDIINMLYADLSHMLRDDLITGIHLLLSDNTIDSNTNAYLVRYHVQYAVDQSRTIVPPSPAGFQREGGLIDPPEHVWRDARFALLIDWNSQARGRRRGVRRPMYNFDWVPEEARFDATNILRYSEGGLVDNTSVVTRFESTIP